MLARRRGVASDADVDEVTGGVFLALVAHDRKLLHRYRPEFRLSTYLGVICRTEVGRLLRRTGRTVSLEGDADERGGGGHEDPRAVSPLAALSVKERAAGLAALRAAVPAALPGRDRLLLTMKFIEGLDYAQIAEVLHLQRDSIGQLLHRAKARLAKAVRASSGGWIRRHDCSCVFCNRRDLGTEAPGAGGVRSRGRAT